MWTYITRYTLSQRPNSISKGMSTNMDKKFIFIIWY